MECALFFPFSYCCHSFLMCCGNRCEQICGRHFPNMPSTSWDFSWHTTHYFVQTKTYWKCVMRKNKNVFIHMWKRNSVLMWKRNLPNVSVMQLSKAQHSVNLEHSNGQIILNYNIWIYGSFHILCSKVAQSLNFNSLANSRWQPTFAVVLLVH